MTDLLTYWHTLRYLKPVQLYGRLWFRLHKPRLNLAAAPDVRPVSDAWCAPARRCQSMSPPLQFRFLNEEHSLADIGWDSPHIEKLWRYNLHYFDDLNAEDAPSRVESHRELLHRWVRENPPAGGTAWEPYPTSLRIVNWIKWALAGNALSPECLHSLAVQVRWLTGRMEIHLLGNHLFANAKALVFAGLHFSGHEAESWLHNGLKILEREIPEQIVSDGGQFERSTMYHALALEDMLDLYNVTRVFQEALTTRQAEQSGTWLECIDRMRHWLTAMCHPDGEISFFNDAAIGIAPAPAELEMCARRLALSPLSAIPDGVTHLAGSGYVRVQWKNSVTLIDVAPVGPDYLPGHAHADTLSFELSLFGQRIMVNSGTSCYGYSAERLRQRGTAAHNTVIVNGENSSETWGGFRVARRARPADLEVTERNGTVTINCSHDGYQRLQGKPTHVRSWHLNPKELIIEDRIEGEFQTAEARFHFHPDVTVNVDTPGKTGYCTFGSGHHLYWTIEAGAGCFEESTYHPRFGERLASRCLAVRFKKNLSRIHFYWD